MNPAAYEEMCQTEQSHWWFVARREILSSLIKKFSKPNQKILEIGAGTGGNLEMLLNYGAVSAVEPNDFARKKILEKFGNKISLINGKLPNQLNLENQSFDLICLFDVLEHVEDDLLALREIKKFLKPNGKIILTVPAFQFLWSSHDKNLHHFRRYNFNNLKKLITNSNLRATRIGYFNCLLFPIAFVMRLIEKIFPAKKSSSTNNCDPITNKILTKIFASEKYFLQINWNFPFGLSLFSVLELDSKKH